MRNASYTKCRDCGGPCSRRAERCRSCREKFRWQDPTDPRRGPVYGLAPGDALWPLCACGCGDPVPARKANDLSRGFAKGEPCRFVAGHSGRPARKDHRDGEKHCANCDEWIAVDCFAHDARRHDGRNPWCRRCQAINTSNYHAANREKRAERARTYRETNLDGIRAYQLRWQQMNRQHHLDYARAQAQAYRARKLGAFVEHVDPLVVLELHDGICGNLRHRCGSFRVRGGSHRSTVAWRRSLLCEHSARAQVLQLPQAQQTR